MLGIYCERAFRAGLLAEPLNTASNLAFFLASWLAWRLWRSAGSRDWPGLALIVILVAIGFGSTAFHASPGRITLLLDVVPIALFILLALGLALVRCLGTTVWVAIPLVALFAYGAPQAARELSPFVPRGSASYVPVLAALALVAGLTAALGRRVTDTRPLSRAAGSLALAAAVFALSLVLRTLDRPACGVLPTGTHFLWHILNALVLWLVLAALLALAPKSAGRT
jgi:hypothetical protein